MRDIYVFTENFRLFYQLISKFKERNIPWIPLNNFSEIPPHDVILVTTQSDMDKYQLQIHPRIRKVLLDPNNPIELSLMYIFQTVRGMMKYKSVTVGIDPGSEVTGLALILDKTYIFAECGYNCNSIIEMVKKITVAFPTQHFWIKIGNGMPRLTRNYLRHFLSSQFFSSLEQVQFYLVDESASSRYTFRATNESLDRHQQAAIAIGLRKGELITNNNLNQILTPNPRPATIKRIQKRSKTLAQFKNVSIRVSKQQAHAIYLGEKTLADLIEEAAALNEDE